jgi:hypothetical protein
MLKNFWKKKNEVKFGLVEDNDFILKNYPISPYKKYLHDFVKQPWVNRCPGLLDYYSPFYVMPMWFDLEIYFDEYNPECIDIECNDYHKHRSIGWHQEDLANTRRIFGNKFYKDVIKLNTPWTFKMPKGYSLIIRPLDYNYNNHFYPFPGLQYDVEPIITLPILLRRDLGSFKISAGEPLVILQILKNDNIKLNIVKDDDELSSHTKYFIDAQNTTIPKRNQPTNELQGLTKMYNKFKGK